MLWIWGGFTAALLTCSWAFWRGGRTERIGAAVIFISWTLSLAVWERGGVNGPGLSVVIIDIVTMVALVILSFWSRRWWTLFAAALHIDTVASHFVANITSFNAYSYITAIGFLGGYGLLLCLAIGVVQTIKTRRQADAAGILKERSGPKK